MLTRSPPEVGVLHEGHVEVEQPIAREDSPSGIAEGILRGGHETARVEPGVRSRVAELPVADPVRPGGRADVGDVGAEARRERASALRADNAAYLPALGEHIASARYFIDVAQAVLQADVETRRTVFRIPVVVVLDTAPSGRPDGPVVHSLPPHERVDEGQPAGEALFELCLDRMEVGRTAVRVHAQRGERLVGAGAACTLPGPGVRGWFC